MAGNLPDKSVDLDGVDVVELLEGLLDLGLVGLDIDDEDEGVVLLDLLHGALGVERVDDDLVLIQTGLMGNRLAEVLGRAREPEGLGAVEGRRGANLALLVRVVLRRPLEFREVEVFMGVDHHISISTFSLLTYASEGSLSSSIGLLQTLRRLGGTACVEKKTHQQSLLNQNSQNLLCSMHRPGRRARKQRQFRRIIIVWEIFVEDDWRLYLWW